MQLAVFALASLLPFVAASSIGIATEPGPHGYFDVVPNFVSAQEIDNLLSARVPIDATPTTPSPRMVLPPHE